MDPKVAALLQLFGGIPNVTISGNSLIASNNPVNTLSFPVPVSVTSSVGPKAPSVHPLNVAALLPQTSVRQSTSQPLAQIPALLKTQYHCHQLEHQQPLNQVSFQPLPLQHKQLVKKWVTRLTSIVIIINV